MEQTGQPASYGRQTREEKCVFSGSEWDTRSESSRYAPRRPLRRETVLMSTVGRRGSYAEFQVVDGPEGTPPTSLSIVELVDRVGIGWYQIIALPLIMGVIFCEGAQLLVTGTIAAGLQREAGFSHGAKASIATISFIGLAVGTALSGIMGDSHGRRGAIIASYWGLVLFGAATTQADNFLSLAFYRFATSSCAGLGVPAAVVMLSEVFPSRFRSILFAVPNAAYTLGEIWGAIGLIIWMPDLLTGDWAMVALWTAIPSAVLMVLSLGLLDESAHWFAVSGRLQDARTVLLTASRMNETSHKMEQLAATCRNRLSRDHESNSEDTSFRRVLHTFGTSNRLLQSLFICSALLVVANLLTFGMSYFWPTVLRSTVTAGGYSPAMEVIQIRIWGFVAVVVCFGAMASPIGHRYLVALAAVACAMALHACESELTNKQDQLLFNAGIIMVGSMVFYACVINIIGETFPTEARGFATGVCLCFSRLGSISAPILLEYLGHQSFLAFVCAASVGAGVLVFILRETKGLPLEDFLYEGRLPPSAYAAGASPLWSGSSLVGGTGETGGTGEQLEDRYPMLRTRESDFFVGSKYMRRR